MSLEGQLLHHSDLQQLQVEGLASFYMLSSGHINRYACLGYLRFECKARHAYG